MRRYQAASATDASSDLGFGVQELNKFSAEIAALLRSKSSNVGGGVALRKAGPQPTLWANSVDAVDLRRSLYEYEYQYDGEYEPEPPEATASPGDETPTETPESTPVATPDATEDSTPTETPGDTPSPTAGATPPSDTAEPTPTVTPPVDRKVSGAVYDGYVKNASVVLQSGEGTFAVATTDAGGKFEFDLTPDATGDLLALAGGVDSFTGKTFPYSMALPFVGQIPDEDVVISPFTTLAYFTRYSMSSLQSMETLSDLVVTSLGLSLPEGTDLATFDAIKGVVNANPGASGRREAIRSLLVSANVMSVVSTTASLYKAVCGVPRAVAGDWAFKAIADAGPVAEQELVLTDEDTVSSIIGSDALIELCLTAINGDQNARKRSLLQNPEEITAELKASAGSVAKAAVELNKLMETAADDESAGSATVITLVATFSYVSQGQLAENAERLGARDISREEFEAAVTPEKLNAAVALVELPAEAISSIQDVITVGLSGNPVTTAPPIDRPASIDEPRKYSAAEIVGISFGPLLGVAAISVVVFLVLMLMKRRAGRKVERFTNDDAEAGLISNEADTETPDAASPSAGADESTYYTMPAPQPPRSPVRFPSKKDPLAPAAARGSTDQQEMDIVSQAKKMEQERARQDFESILKAQQDYITKASESAAAGSAPPAPPAMPTEEEQQPPLPPPPAAPEQSEDEHSSASQ